MTGVRPTVLGLALCALACSGPPDAPGGTTATVRLATEPGELTCADFCVDSVSVSAFRVGDVLALDIRTVPCGDPVVFDELPAGTEIYVQASLTSGPSVLMSGTSEPVTVPSGGVKDIEVPLEPGLRPTLDAASPDPLVLADEPTELTLSGAGMGFGAGLSQVEIDGQPLQTKEGAWANGEVTVTVPGTTVGSALVVRSCGVASTALPLRLVGKEPAWSRFQLPGCNGLDVRGAAGVPGTEDVRVAAACGGTDAGVLLTFLAGACAQAPESISLDGTPVDVSVSPGPGLDTWIAYAEGPVVRVPAGAPAPVPSAWNAAIFTPRALAASPGAVHVIGVDKEGKTTLQTVGAAPRAGPPTLETGVGPGTELIDVVHVPGELLLAARHPDGVGKLIVFPLSDGATAEWVLPQCSEPTALDSDGGDWVAVACAGSSPGVQALHRGDSKTHWIATPGVAGGSVAVDLGGDVAFVWQATGGRLAGVHMPTDRLLADWDLEQGAAGAAGAPLVLAGGGGSRLVLGGPDAGELSVLSPYMDVAGGVAPCE